MQVHMDLIVRDVANIDWQMPVTQVHMMYSLKHHRIYI